MAKFFRETSTTVTVAALAMTIFGDMTQMELFQLLLNNPR
jgi:hypothetical protein